MRDGTNEAIRKQRLLVTDTKGCVGDATRLICFAYTVKRGAPILICGLF
jgi:hypothetical protein